jgi:hypothetical protein
MSSMPANPAETTRNVGMQPDQAATTSVPVAEPNILLPHGRIGSTALVFRWSICLPVLTNSAEWLRDAGIGYPEVVSYIVAIPFGAFMLVNCIKRAHDMGHSGWAVPIFAIMPILFAIPGVKQANKYGPVPVRLL